MENIEKFIYNINGKNVILDRDIANLYNMETKVLNQAVKRNINDFEKNSTWKLTNDQKEDLWSQIVTTNFNKMSRVNPRVFTENGVKILAGLIRKNDVKVVTPLILDAFKNKNNTLVISSQTIENKGFHDMIYIIRKVPVMLDFDLAKIYGYTTKSFNQQVKNNIEKFDSDFMFRLTEEELLNLRSNFLTSSSENNYGGRRYLPYAFTEQGIYMLMTVLKGNLATRQSKTLIRMFKNMKDYITNNGYITYKDFSSLALQTTKNTIAINEIKENMITKSELTDIIKSFNNTLIKRHYLIANGKQVEADLAYKEIYSQATKSIFIIDNYINLKTLILLKDINKSIKLTIFSDNINNNLHKIEYNDFKKEYNIKINLKTTNNKYHDRYIVIDYNTKEETIYHCGSSSKDSGNRITTITTINDTKIYHPLIEELLKNKDLILK